ncbi:hypothetical protein T440DRAFT_473830 [Plenodomus tracheiphilus IPT5]|uniref:Vegetative cell wall protein gp1 n=1 Tax=Plenodomus tracheiphilus IPT5 TaxID=1408161 RepID=A0A6A7AP98_9PLEO|nr:hypothetical protein T440DRAFT_473830 [Plenodomus tracheiphilus IPT5]
MYAPHYTAFFPGYGPSNQSQFTPPIFPSCCTKLPSPRYVPQISVSGNGYDYSPAGRSFMFQHRAAGMTLPHTLAIPRCVPQQNDHLDYDPYIRRGCDTGASRLRRSNSDGKCRLSRTAHHTRNVPAAPNRGYDCADIYNGYDHSPPLFDEQYMCNDRHEDGQRYDRDQNSIYNRGHRRSHLRRGSASSQHTPKKPAPAVSVPKATEEDACRAGIPAGYSCKHWDPFEKPILLLGSVFDANSLGRWIYDWTVLYHGPGSPLVKMAGELRLLLIQLAGKIKKADKTMPKILKCENYEMLNDFLKSGKRLWVRLAELLKVCGDYMWEAAKKESGKDKPDFMGENSGNEFVESIFGRERELETTKKLMAGMQLWSMRFDANCEYILQYPSVQNTPGAYSEWSPLPSKCYCGADGYRRLYSDQRLGGR